LDASKIEMDCFSMQIEKESGSSCLRSCVGLNVGTMLPFQRIKKEEEITQRMMSLINGGAKIVETILEEFSIDVFEYFIQIKFERNIDLLLFMP
jgi:hypothetical protein